MAIPVFDTGVFLILMGIAFGCLIGSRKIGSLFLIVSTAIFLMLGLVLVTGQDVVSYKITSDGTSTINETNYFITNTQQNQNIQWLGWILLAFALISAGKFVIDLHDDNVPIL